MTNDQFKKWKPSADHVERIWAKALEDWREAREQKQRAIAAMIAAGQRQAREASK